PHDPFAEDEIAVGARQGFLWRPGGFHLVHETPWDSEFLAVNRAGWIAVAYWTLEQRESESTHDFGDGPETWTYAAYVPTYGLLVPENDADGNGLPDHWEQRWFGATGQNPEGDPDGDGLSNLEEYAFGTRPDRADTDGDGTGDRAEIAFGLSPHDGSDAAMDLDGDGIPNGWGPAHGPDPPDPGDAGEDPDGDGHTNLQEYAAGSDPGDPDSDPTTVDLDGDGMNDAWEAANGLDPLDPADADHDWDYDGLTNLQEYQAGTDPK